MASIQVQVDRVGRSDGCVKTRGLLLAAKQRAKRLAQQGFQPEAWPTQFLHQQGRRRCGMNQQSTGIGHGDAFRQTVECPLDAQVLARHGLLTLLSDLLFTGRLLLLQDLVFHAGERGIGPALRLQEAATQPGGLGLAPVMPVGGMTQCGGLFAKAGFNLVQHVVHVPAQLAEFTALGNASQALLKLAVRHLGGNPADPLQQHILLLQAPGPPQQQQQAGQQTQQGQWRHAQPQCLCHQPQAQQHQRPGDKAPGFRLKE